MTEKARETAQGPEQPQPDERAASSEVPPAPPHEMRLRGQPPGVTRLSRRVLIGASAMACGSVLVALSFALWPHRQTAVTQPASTGANILPDRIATLPKDYIAANPVPKLGPPLPGDLGKPMLKAGITAPGMPAPATPEQQRIAQEGDAARASHLFAMTNVTPSKVTATAGASGTAMPAAAASASPTDQDQKLAFLNAGTDHQTQSPEHLQAPPSPYVIQAGTVIAAALITGLRSDLPGQVTAQVTEDCFDSPSGTVLVVPQGSKLIGQYQAQISFGQSRVLLAWTRLILPNGKSIILDRQPATDASGYAGLEDQVDQHWGALFEAATLSTILSVGSEAGTTDSENNLAQAIRQGASQSFSQVGQQVVGRSLNVQPTLTIRPGFPVRVLVTHDLVLEPYRQ